MTIGDIGSLIDSLEWDGIRGDMPSVCHVYGDVYAVVYSGYDLDGYICTFTIDDHGNLGATIIDVWEYETTYATYPEIIKVYGTVYAVVYTDVNVYGQLMTFSIANDGIITKSAINTLRYSQGFSNAYQLYQVGDNAFAIIFNDENSDGWLQTVGISNTGTIISGEIDKTEFDGVQGREGNMCNVAGDVYAIAYDGPGDDGFLITLSINSSGIITNASIDTFEFELGYCVYPSIVKAREPYFAIAYAGPGADGWITIVEIDHLGNITEPIVDSYEFDTVQGTYPCLIALGQGYLALSVCRTGSYLWLMTFAVDIAGSLNSTTLDSAQIEAGACTFSTLLSRFGDYYAIIYCGVDEDGWARTITVETPVAGLTPHIMMMGLG